MGKIKAVLIDLSGTLHIDDDPTPGAVEALSRLQSLPGLKIKYVTNTTKESKRVLMERLNKIGFSNITEDAVFTSLSAARKLLEDRQLRPYFLVDKKAMEDFQEEFGYENMNTAMRLLHDGAELIAIHKARYFQRKDGPALGPGPFVSALEYASDVKATVVGKPTEQFFLSSIAGFDCSPQECVMIGDDARDDIGGAQAAGMQGILVRTGKYREGDENKISPPPCYVVNAFADAVKVIESLL